jgi:hypothetical protein
LEIRESADQLLALAWNRGWTGPIDIKLREYRKNEEVSAEEGTLISAD